jgi:hypothetical protein
LPALAAWLSVMAGALATALQLWLSGASNLQTVTIAMLGVHALIGIGEALITVAALSFIFRTRPDLVGEGSASSEGGRGWVIAGVVISLVVVLLSPLASGDPDGLERVAIDMGFIDAGQAAPYRDHPGLYPAVPGRDASFHDHCRGDRRPDRAWHHGCDRSLVAEEIIMKWSRYVLRLRFISLRTTRPPFVNHKSSI